MSKSSSQSNLCANRWSNGDVFPRRLRFLGLNPCGRAPYAHSELYRRAMMCIAYLATRGSRQLQSNRI